jgi:uncharacterized protein (DUF302 family)
MKRIVLAAPALALAMVAGSAQAELVRKQSPHSVSETIDRLEVIVKAKGLTVFNRIDHAAGAKKVDQELRPTELIIFGSPAVGTPLMREQQTLGLALPLKVLAWEDAEGKVWLAYEAPADMAAAHGLSQDNSVIKRIASTLDGFTNAAVVRK